MSQNLNFRGQLEVSFRSVRENLFKQLETPLFVDAVRIRERLREVGFAHLLLLTHREFPKDLQRRLLEASVDYLKGDETKWPDTLQAVLNTAEARTVTLKGDFAGEF